MSIKTGKTAEFYDLVGVLVNGVGK